VRCGWQPEQQPACIPVHRRRWLHPSTCVRMCAGGGCECSGWPRGPQRNARQALCKGACPGPGPDPGPDQLTPDIQDRLLLHAPCAPPPQESSAALQLLLAQGMRHVAGQLLHMRGEVGLALATYLSLQEPAPVFTYIHRCACQRAADGCLPPPLCLLLLSPCPPPAGMP
jgi:hypothetical protein